MERVGIGRLGRAIVVPTPEEFIRSRIALPEPCARPVPLARKIKNWWDRVWAGLPFVMGRTAVRSLRQRFQTNHSHRVMSSSSHHADRKACRCVTNAGIDLCSLSFLLAAAGQHHTRSGETDRLVRTAAESHRMPWLYGIGRDASGTIAEGDRSRLLHHALGLVADLMRRIFR